MQTVLSSRKKQSGFTLVEVILVLVIMGIIVTMVSNPGLLRQKDSVTTQKITSLLVSFIDQRKLDMFLGKNLGKMYVDSLSMEIDTQDTENLLILDYTLRESQLQDKFEGFVPEDNNLTYFFRHEDFECDSVEGDFQVVLSCGFPSRIADFVDVDMITCDTNASASGSLNTETVLLQGQDIAYANEPTDVQILLKVIYKGLFARQITWDRRTGVIYDTHSEVSQPLTCSS